MKIITIAMDLEQASINARQLYTEADETDSEFRWVAVSAHQLEGIVVLPALKKILPTI